MIKRRESKGGKTVYGHVDFAVKSANEVAIKRLLGKQFHNATRVLRKGIRLGVFLENQI